MEFCSTTPQAGGLLELNQNLDVSHEFVAIDSYQKNV